MLSVLSCLDTRKNQRKSRLKSPTRWVPRGRNCHAAQLAPPAAWLKQCRLGIPTPRSAPDPFAGHAFMPFYLYQQRSTILVFMSYAGNTFPRGAKDKDKYCLANDGTYPSTNEFHPICLMAQITPANFTSKFCNNFEKLATFETTLS